MNFYYFIASRIAQSKNAFFSHIINRIAIVSIAVGLAIMLIAFSILIGFQQSIQDKLFSFTGHLTITKRGWGNESSLSASQGNPLSLRTSLYKDKDKIPSIKALHAIARKPCIIKTQDEVLGVMFKGIGKDYAPELFEKNIVEGQFLKLSKKNSKDILISRRIASKLRIALGDTILLVFAQQPPRFRKLKVSGIYETGLENFDQKFIIGSIAHVQRLNAWQDTLVGSYEIFLKDFRADSAYVARKSTLIYKKMAYDTIAKTVMDRDMYRGIFDWLRLLNKNVVIFLGLILIVASFNMVSVLIIMIMERVQMIGLLKALGATDWQIRKIFIYQGFILVLKGCLWGNTLGLGFCALQYFFEIIPLDAENYFMNTVPIAWSLSNIVLMNALIMTIVGVILLIPTWIVSRIRPIKAIRFD